MRRTLGAACAAALISTLAYAPASSVAQEPAVKILRVGVEDLFFTSGFDPTGEYLNTAWALHTNLVTRTLLTYRHIAGVEGTELVPDLATEVPQPSPDGLTYTFHLKNGIRFGPPLDREIVCRDFEYAFRRIATERLVAQYANYYRVIEGFVVGADPGPGGIAGIRCDDDKTLTIKLKRPTGDFLHRLAMPAAGPIPKEVARCARRAGVYGRYVVASGPYMLKGSESLDPTSCDGLRALWSYEDGMTFVRNPSYDAATDSPEVRENLLDEVRLREMTRRRIIERLAARTLDTAVTSIYANASEFEAADVEIHANASDRTWYVTMNLTRKPFDDIHVRRALNLAIDKRAMRRSWGGELAGEIATHILPPTLTSGIPTSAEYDPYATPEHRGSLDAAQEAMRASRYDRDGDGLCDAAACDGVLLQTSRTAPHSESVRPVARAMRQLGITPRVRRVFDAYTPIISIRRGIPISARPGWGKDYPDPATFMKWLFHSDRLKERGCFTLYNYSLLGASPQLKERCDAPGNFRNVPSVDEEIDQCDSLPLGSERTQCWVDLDKHLMENVVPWVPYLWQNILRPTTPAVVKYEYDQSTDEMAFSHIDVDPSQQPLIR